MTKPVALAKLSRPRLHQAVPRERLFGLLDRALRSPVIWLAAPPGAGKTTLVATYLEAGERPVIWYQVDPGDADPAGFFYHLAFAAAGAARSKRGALPQLAPEHLGELAGFVRRFFREMFTHFRDGATLVFDNFQEASGSGLAEILRHAVREIPDGINVIVLSRAEPPAELAELQARGSLAAIDWNELRLNLEETRAMSAAKGVVEDWVVRALHQQSDGWAAGLTLMLERFKRAGSGEGTLPADTRESVFNYFASLVFDQVADATRDTLLCLAFVPRVTPSLAQFLSGNPDAGKLLESLHRRHLFTDRRSGPEHVYQFHALFQAFLRAMAADAFAPRALRERMRQTGLALEERGDIEPAFEALVHGELWDEAGRLVIAQASKLLETGRWQTLNRWITALPEAQRQIQPWLEYWLAWAQVQTHPASSVATFQRAQARFAEIGDRSGRTLSVAGLLHACSVDHMDYQTIDGWLDVLADATRVPGLLLTAEQELRTLSALLWAAFFARPWHDCISASLDRVEALLASEGDAGVALEAAISALTVASQSCQMDRCDRLGSLVRTMVGRAGVSPVLAAWAWFQLAHQCFLRADYDGSAACFETVWSIAEENELKRVLTAALMHRFMIDFRLHDLAAAEAAMRRIQALPAPKHALSQGLLICYRARLAQVQGQQQAAADLATQSDAAILRTGAGFFEMIYGLINADILLGAGQANRARPLIDRARTIIERSSILFNVRPSLVLLEAWLAEQDGSEQESFRLVRIALEQCQSGYGWCQMRYVDATCAHMFRVALERGILPDVARRLIRTFRLKPHQNDIAVWPWPLRVHVLGRFDVQTYDRALELGRKTPRKALALLKALIALGPREVPEQQLIDALWPDEEGDAGHKALSVTLLRLRRLLGDHELIRQQGGKFFIDCQKCWVDAWSFEQRLAQASLNGHATGLELRALEDTLALYSGAFLPEDAGEPWAVPTRERLRAKFVHALAGFGTHLEALGRYDDAISWYLKGLDADAIVEPFYHGLMRCYDRLDRRPEALGAYRRLRQILSATLGLQPSKTSEKLYQSLRLV